MKHTNKIIALVLALMMVLSLATTASAAAMEGELDGGSITITSAVEGATYKAYQILYLESYDADHNAYSYKANSDWAEWLKAQTTFVSVDDDGYVTWVEGASAADFAAAAQTQLAGKTAAGSDTADASGAEITGLKLGYYLVDTNIGALCSLDTTNPNAEVEEKNEVPDIDKEVKEDSNDAWGKVNDADAGQIVEYRATVTVQKGAENYIVHDRMDEALDFVRISSVTVNGQEVADANYDVDYNVSHAEGHKHAGKTCTFDIAFDNDYIADLAAGTQIVILYEGKLNEKALVKTGIPNEIDMQFGDENDSEWTPTIVTKTYTWDLKVIKVDGKDKVTRLAGATFKLTADEAGETPIRFHDMGDNKYRVCADTACAEEHVTEFTTTEAGEIYIECLDADIYYLHEVNAPTGYNKLADPIEVEIKANVVTGETVTMSYSTVEKTIENNAGVELPDTGGIGTTIFYALGGILVVAAVVLLVTKKRMASGK